MLSLTSGKKITNEKVFKYQSAGDKTIEIVESAKLPQLAHHLRPIFGLVLKKTQIWSEAEISNYLQRTLSLEAEQRKTQSGKKLLLGNAESQTQLA